MIGDRLQNEMLAGLAAVRRAAQLCKAVQSEIGAEAMQKQDKSPVTIADFGSQAIACRELADAFPNDPVIGEEDSTELRRPDQAAFLNDVRRRVVEAGIASATNDDVCRWIDRGGAASGGSRFWTLDPIDGTKGFLRKEQYAISLALIVEGRIELGILGCPNLPERPDLPLSAVGSLFVGIRGTGAWSLPLMGDGVSDAQPIHVAPTSDSAQARFCESVESGHSAHDASSRIAAALGISRAGVRLDSQAKYAVVARGEAELYLRLPTRKDYAEMIWDHAGGVIVVEEAGGRVTDVDGKPLEFHHGRRLTANRGVLASNGRLHDPLVEAVRAALANG